MTKLTYNGKLIAKGPITKGPQTFAEVLPSSLGPLNLVECTCEICRREDTRIQTDLEHLGGEDRPEVPHTGR